MTGPLRNPKHELFAQARFKGLSADAAYAKAGYTPSRANATRLTANETIKARVAELQAAAAKKVTDQSGWDAITLFNRIRMRGDAAAAAGDHKTAADCEKYIASCFGYDTSPTLTHEHVRGTKLKDDEAAAANEERSERNVIPLAHAIRALAKFK